MANPWSAGMGLLESGDRREIREPRDVPLSALSVSHPQAAT